MGDLNYTTDIAPIQNKYFDDSGMTTKFSGRERQALMREYQGLTAQRLEGAQSIIQARRQQAELERQQQLLLEDSQKRRRQAEIDSKLGKATKQLNRALKGETLEDKALGVLEVQSRFAELAGTNPAFQVLLDAANRKISFLGGQEKALLDAQGRTTTATPKADPAKVRMWQADFDAVSKIRKQVSETTFGATSSKPTYDSGELANLKLTVAPTYGIDPDQYDDDDEFVRALNRRIREMAPTGAADTTESGEEENPYASGFEE